MTSEQISFPVRCAHCQAEMDSAVVCEACNALQPVGEQVETFELLQLPATFRLDGDELDSVYLRLTRMIHPDYFGRTGGPEKSLSEELSARINNAYRTLRDPLRRSEELLRRAGGKSATEDKRIEPGLLAEVLELREQIESAKAGKRAAELAGLNAGLARRLERAFAELAGLHERLESAQSAGDDPAVASLRDAIRLELNGIRYLQGLVRESAR